MTPATPASRSPKTSSRCGAKIEAIDHEGSGRSALALLLRGVDGAVRPDDLRAVQDGMTLLVASVQWERPLAWPQLSEAQELVELYVPLDTSDRRRTWRDLCLGVAMAVQLSRLQPGWMVEVVDPTGLLSLGMDRSEPLILRGGAATRPRRDGPPSPAADRDRALKTALWNALGAELGAQWGLLPPPKKAEPTGEPSVAESAPVSLSSSVATQASPMSVSEVIGARLIRATATAATAESPAALDLELELVNPTDRILHEVGLLVVLRDGAGHPLGVDELALPALGPNERRQVRRQEPLVHRASDIAAVELQVRVRSLARVHGVSAVGWESS